MRKLMAGKQAFNLYQSGFDSRPHDQLLGDSMDTIIIRNRPNGERISVTLGPEGHKLSKIELMRMISTAIENVQQGGGRSIDLTL